jgi:hypothetical protein
MIVVIIDVIFNIIYGHNKDNYIKKIIVKYGPDCNGIESNAS